MDRREYGGVHLHKETHSECEWGVSGKYSGIFSETRGMYICE